MVRGSEGEVVHPVCDEGLILVNYIARILQLQQEMEEFEKDTFW